MSSPSASSTPPDPCGTGQLDPGEECDDGNSIDADGCSATCKLEFNVLFVTSTLYTVPSLGGVSGADAACQSHAAAGNLRGNFIAFIADNAGPSLRDRFGDALGWVRTDSKPFGDDFISDHVLYPPELDESGSAVGATPSALGEVTLPDSTCSDWTSTTSTGLIAMGDPTGGYQGWQFDFFGTCTASFRLYCFQKDFHNPVRVVPVAGRTAFVSETAWLPSGCIAAADAVCQDDAQNSGLPGTYRAFLATSTASASSRFDTSGAPWVRVDGIPITSLASDLGRSNGRFAASLQVTASGSIRGNDTAWTGSGDPSARGTLATTCNDWESSASSDNGTSGTVQYSVFSKALGSGPATTCAGSGIYLYCLQL